MVDDTKDKDKNPLQISHGKVLLTDIRETKAIAREIQELLDCSEESPVLDTLIRIEAKIDTLIDLLMPRGRTAEGR